MEHSPSPSEPASLPTSPPAVSGARQAITLVQRQSPTSQPNELAPGVFGEYDLLAELGRGGMGIVFKARQKSLDRILAIKTILVGSVANPDDLQRFRTEAESAAQLRHPNIVAIHEVGQWNGQDFYTMD